MMNWNVGSTLKKAGLVAAAALLAVSGAASAAAINTGPCVVGSNGPIPPGCTYRTPAQIHAQGLQNQINLSAEHGSFVNPTYQQGGIYHGEVERFDSTLVLHIDGINALKGISATVRVPTHCETHIGPREATADFQQFETEMYDLQGAASDANFSSIKIVAGTANGLPSPGATSLTRQRDGSFLVNSSFRMNFHIELVGAKGGPFDGVNISSDGVAGIQAFAN
jgi:hypothetical protein